MRTYDLLMESKMSAAVPFHDHVLQVVEGGQQLGILISMGTTLCCYVTVTPDAAASLRWFLLVPTTGLAAR